VPRRWGTTLTAVHKLDVGRTPAGKRRGKKESRKWEWERSSKRVKERKGRRKKKKGVTRRDLSRESQGRASCRSEMRR
jgi:hypothetical protein